jgi:D-sedoheptulose 7-phosphate isomerase
MDKIEFLKSVIKENNEIQKNLESSFENIIRISEKIADCLHNNGCVFLCGNGGSAADAQHVSAEFIGRFNKNRKALAAEALTTNSSILTAISNDYSFEDVFSRQVEARVKKEDIVVGISTSGKSKNVINALLKAKKIKITTIGFTGNKSNEMNDVCDFLIQVPSEKTSRIQENHIMIWHMICELIEQNIEKI